MDSIFTPVFLLLLIPRPEPRVQSDCCPAAPCCGPQWDGLPNTKFFTLQPAVPSWVLPVTHYPPIADVALQATWGKRGARSFHRFALSGSAGCNRRERARLDLARSQFRCPNFFLSCLFARHMDVGPSERRGRAGLFEVYLIEFVTIVDDRLLARNSPQVGGSYPSCTVVLQSLVRPVDACLCNKPSAWARIHIPRATIQAQPRRRTHKRHHTPLPIPR